jgi:AcrR family transcriptional regulator
VTKKLILEKALEFFTDKGYDGASMDDIARAVGIRKASLYAHFEGKERIFLAVFDDILEEYARTVEALTAPTEEGALEALERIFLSFIEYCHGNRKMYFWDRYFYYPPVCVEGIIGEKTQETQDVFLDRIRWWMARGMEQGMLRAQPVTSASLAYYYLMIGLSMSVRMYEKDAMMSDARAAWEGLRLGL